jgi:hypothetical protein
LSSLKDFTISSGFVPAILFSVTLDTDLSRSCRTGSCLSDKSNMGTVVTVTGTDVRFLDKANSADNCLASRSLSIAARMIKNTLHKNSGDVTLNSLYFRH